MARTATRAAVAVAVLAAGLLAARGGTAATDVSAAPSASSGAPDDGTHCPVPVSHLSVLGMKAAPDSLDGACDALRTDGGREADAGTGTSGRG